MKKVLVVLWGMLMTVAVLAQSGKKNDTLAILIIDRMSDVIGDLESCSFKLNTANDIADPAGLVKYFSDYEVYMSGSNKMLINAHGNRGHRQLMYNGHQLAYYSFDENNYGVIPAPASTIAAIDSLHAQYDIEFPAADFFYPAFTDDLIENSDSIRFLGKERIGAKEYFHVIAYGKEQTFQFWVNNDAYNLPARLAITYKNQKGNPQFIAIFSEWEINPALPAAMFDFLPPPGATKVRIMSKADR